MLIESIFDFAIALCYIVLALSPSWINSGLGTFLLRATFFFCGFGHVVHALHGALPFQVWVDGTTAVIGFCTVMRIILSKEHVVIAEGD